MLYPAPGDWQAWGIQDESHQFFCLHWTELFDAETPDTWQVRSCNVNTLLQELIDASQTAREFEAYRGVMRAILDETFAVVSRDEILGRFYPFVSAYLEPWRKSQIAEKAVSEVERLARVIQGNLKDYWENGVKLVLELLTEADGGKKKHLYAATMNLAVETVARGRYPSHVRERFISSVLRASESPFLKRVQDLFDEFTVRSRNYQCVFFADGIRRHDAEGLPADITLALGPPAVIEPGAAEEFYKHVSKSAPSLWVRVEAADPEAARHRAEKRLGELFAAKNLFNVDARFGVRALKALVVDEAGEKTIVERQRLGSQYLGAYDARVLKVDLLFRVESQLRRVAPPDASQLAAVIEYHRLALLANNDEARLVNLWVALEALCQGGDGSIIERVWSRIAPCVAVDNVRRNLISLSIFLRKLWTVDNDGDFSSLFPNSNKDRLEPDDLARVLLLPDGHADLKKLCKLCRHHSLILHRLFRAHSLMLDRAVSVKNNIEYTRQNVEWQIKRIYRARNAIVHTGSCNLLLTQITQHLHCYLVKAVRSVLLDIDRQPLWTIRDSLEHRFRLFERVAGLFGSTAGHEIGLASVLEPEACLKPQTAPFAWAAPEAAPAPPQIDQPNVVAAANPAQQVQPVQIEDPVQVPNAPTGQPEGAPPAGTGGVPGG